MAEMTVPEQDTFTRERETPRRVDAHMRAALAQWFVVALARVIRHEVAAGYRIAKSRDPLEPLDIRRLLKRAPGYDKTLVPKRKRRRR